jgi:hypothetical protein
MIDLNYETKDEFYELLDLLVGSGFLENSGIKYRASYNSGITRLIYVTLSIPMTSEDIAREVLERNRGTMFVSDYNYIVHVPLYSLFKEDLIDVCLPFQVFENKNVDILSNKTKVKNTTLDLNSLKELVNTGREIYVYGNSIYYI